VGLNKIEEEEAKRNTCTETTRDSSSEVKHGHREIRIWRGGGVEKKKRRKKETIMISRKMASTKSKGHSRRETIFGRCHKS